MSTAMNKNGFDFTNLVVFEMANNHQGFLEHGKRIVGEMGRIARDAGVRAAVKLQFRDLDTFIHPAYRESKENKHIARFLSTRLSEEQFGELVNETKRQGMLAMVTPFDEASVAMIERLGVDIVKIGSCSAHDWPLLERVSEVGKPVIVSTGGLRLHEIDRIVSFLEHRGVDFALMHCVAVYPTPADDLHLNQIELMRRRYPGLTVGFSTHEDPSNTTFVGLAYAKGARIFEKHVGIATNDITLNSYSATPEQAAAWVAALKEAIRACGGEGERRISEKEIADLHSLMRGVFLGRDVRAGERLTREDVFFAIPLQPGQMRSGRFREGFVADRNYTYGEALAATVEPVRPTRRDIIYSAIRSVKAMFNEAQIPLSYEFPVELSHHFGLSRFHEVGCVIVECFNRDYAKKLIVQLPGQWNPEHYHKEKEETFHVLSGVVDVQIEGQRKTLYPGDVLWVPRGAWHAFYSAGGAIIEEVSTTSRGSDSYYIDRSIARIPREVRKTRLVNWGRHQFDNAADNEAAESSGLSGEAPTISPLAPSLFTEKKA